MERNAVRKYFLVPLLLVASTFAADVAIDRPTVVVVAGAPGDSEFTTVFDSEVKIWTDVCAHAEAKSVIIGTGAADATIDHDRLKQALATEPKDSIGELWLVLVGHGTFDGKEAKFNLRGRTCPRPNSRSG